MRMRFEEFSFGSIRIDGTTYEHDVMPRFEPGTSCLGVSLA
jgi:hypothetical protein